MVVWSVLARMIGSGTSPNPEILHRVSVHAVWNEKWQNKGAARCSQRGRAVHYPLEGFTAAQTADDAVPSGWGSRMLKYETEMRAMRQQMMLPGT